MFSGIIETLGTVALKQSSGRSVRLEVAADHFDGPVAEGESIAVNGVCLTVEEVRKNRFAVSLSPQTARETTLGRCAVGDRVNLERALKVGGRIGGHLLTGHIDFVTTASFSRDGDSVVCRLRIPSSHRRYVARRGSIAVDGVSLTVAHLSAGIATIWLIPYTLSVTTLSRKRSGEPLNVEVDLIAKYLARIVGEDDDDAADGVQFD